MWLWKQKYERAVDSFKEMFVKCYVWCSGRVEKQARKTWNTQEMISNMYERRNWMNFSEKGRNEDRKLKNELKRAAGKAKKECLEKTFDKNMELKKNIVMT